MKKIRISPPVAPSKPIKPLEEQFMSSILLRQENEFSMTLEELMNEIPEEAKLSELSIEVDRDYDAYGGDFDTIYFYLRWERMEKTIGYEEILSLYEKEMKEYKEEIKKYRKSKILRHKTLPKPYFFIYYETI